MAPKIEIFSKILEKYDKNFTDSEKNIADYILRNPNESITFSVHSLAEVTHTSKATVVRFARTLGYSGFLEFKADLLKRASKELAFSMASLKNWESKKGSVAFLVGEAESANIRETVTNIDEIILKKFVNAMENAKIIYTLGSGSSSILCKIASYQLNLVGKRSIALPESVTSFEEQLALAPPQEDLLWLFSFPPYSSRTLEVARWARQRHLPVVAITDRPQSPVAQFAVATLFASNNNILPMNSIASSVVLITTLQAQLSIQNATLPYALNLAKAFNQAME